VTTTQDSAVLVERRGDALWLALNRPEAMNGLHPIVLDGLEAGLDEAAADSSIRCVVITGQGRAFCAGADLKFAQSLAGLPRPDGEYSASQLFLRRVEKTFLRIETFGKPVIAAVQGVAMGGGLELALCCDLIIASESARLGDGHAKYGQVPGGGASVRLPRRVGIALAKRLMFTGELLPAGAYAGTDLISTVVPDDELTDEVDRLAAVIASGSPVGLARMKRLVNDALQVPTEVGLRMELEQSALHELSEDWREGIAAFAEKREPKFPGR
jgi:enoyl-CoA hydratase